MASRIKGITVEIGGDTSGLEKALSDVNNSIKKTQSQLRDVKQSPEAGSVQHGASGPKTGTAAVCYRGYREETAGLRAGSGGCDESL